MIDQTLKEDLFKMHIDKIKNKFLLWANSYKMKSKYFSKKLAIYNLVCEINGLFFKCQKLQKWAFLKKTVYK